MAPTPVRFVPESPGIAPQTVTQESQRRPISRYAGRGRSSRSLRGLETRGTASCCIRSKSSRLAIHPFRDVNTRSQHVFFNQLARDAGWIIDWSQIPGDVFAHARTLAIVQDPSGLDALIRPSLVTVEDAEQHDRLMGLLQEHAQGFTTRKSTRDPAVLDRELDTARERRRTLPPLDAFGHDAPPGGDRGGPSLGR